MDNLSAGTVWKSKRYLNYMLEITEVTDTTVGCRECHPNRETISYARDEFVESFEFYMTEYRLPYDVGSEYI